MIRRSVELTSVHRAAVLRASHAERLPQVEVTEMDKVLRFLRSEDGPTAVEYAVMAALIIVVCVTAVGTIGTNAQTTFTTIGSKLPTN